MSAGPGALVNCFVSYKFLDESRVPWHPGISLLIDPPLCAIHYWLAFDCFWSYNNIFMNSLCSWDKSWYWFAWYSFLHLAVVEWNTKLMHTGTITGPYCNNTITIFINLLIFSNNSLHGHLSDKSWKGAYCPKIYFNWLTSTYFVLLYTSYLLDLRGYWASATTL